MNFDFAVLTSNWQLFAQGLAETVLICLVSVPIGFTVGTCLALGGLRGGTALKRVTWAYVEVARNVPFLVQVFLLYFALPAIGIRLGAVSAGITALASYAAAYFSEILRGALAAIPRGQTEAARALGLSMGQTFRLVLVPQALGYVLPAGGNLAITLIKESAVLSVITVRELTYMSQDIIGRTFAPVEVFTVLALVYWALTATLSAATTRLESALRPRGMRVMQSYKPDFNTALPSAENPR
jgi:polar amino acid transport system permease protein